MQGHTPAWTHTYSYWPCTLLRSNQYRIRNAGRARTNTHRHTLKCSVIYTHHLSTPYPHTHTSNITHSKQLLVEHTNTHTSRTYTLTFRLFSTANTHTHTHTNTHFSSSNLCMYAPFVVVILQILSNRKGLLPEPNLAQLLTSMTNPAALQILMRPYHTGKRGGMSVEGV